MTNNKIRRIWKKAGGPTTDYAGIRFSAEDWMDIQKDVRRILKQKNDKYAARIIAKIVQPWTTTNTEIGFVRRLRLAAKSTK